MSWTYPGQMFENTLTALKGWPFEHAIDLDGNLSASVNIGSVGTAPLPGQCVHVASTTTGAGPNGDGPNVCVFEMGANIKKMPIFLWPGYNHFDVQNPGVPAGVALGGTTANPPAWVPIRPTGKLMGLVAAGAYELETTEFDTAQTYAVNDFLRAVTSNTDANAGKLTNQDASGGQAFATTAKCVWGDPGVAAWDSVVGVVSRGKYTNSLGKSVLSFWPRYMPGTR